MNEKVPSGWMGGSRRIRWFHRWQWRILRGGSWLFLQVVLSQSMTVGSGALLSIVKVILCGDGDSGGVLVLFAMQTASGAVLIPSGWVTSRWVSFLVPLV